MTSAEPILFWAMREIASPTVVEGLTEYRPAFMTSRTVATLGFYAGFGNLSVYAPTGPR
jgi:hypothetical protein